MSASEPYQTQFDGVRVRYDSAKSYDELVAALLADIGETPVVVNDLVTSTDSWESFQERVQSYVGPSGFMLFGLLDHGEPGSLRPASTARCCASSSATR